MFSCHKPSVAKGFNMNCGEHCEKVCLIPAGGERLSVLTLSSVSKSSHQGFLFIYNIHNMPLAWIKKHDFEGRNLRIWKRRKGRLRRKHRRIEVLKEHSWEACSVHGGAPSTRLLVFLPRNTSSTLLKWGSAKPEDALTTWEHAWQPRGTDVRKGKRDGKEEKVGNSGARDKSERNKGGRNWEERQAWKKGARTGICCYCRIHLVQACPRNTVSWWGVHSEHLCASSVGGGGTDHPNEEPVLQGSSGSRLCQQCCGWAKSKSNWAFSLAISSLPQENSQAASHLPPPPNLPQRHILF